MNTLDELITQVLREEAQDAPRSAAFVKRMLDGGLRSTPPPRRPPSWLVPVAVAATTALIVSVAVASSLAGRSGSNGSPTGPGPSGTTRGETTPAVEIPADHAGRLPGWLALSSGPVHIEMNAVPPEHAPGLVWQVGCPDSVLSTFESGDVACGGAGHTPRYEIMVSSGPAPADVVSDNARWDAPLRPVEAPESSNLGGTPVVVSTTAGDVRYGCPGNCGRWETRDLTVIGFPDQGAHVMILGPPGKPATVDSFGHLAGGDVWLDYIYVDP